MKKLFAPLLTWAWLSGRLPNRLFFFGKKTPWYRKSARAFGPWLDVALMTPLVLFLGWKGLRLMRGVSFTATE